MASESTATETTLDVRDIDGPPFDDIVAALEALTADERLRLIVPFEPKPLYEVLEARGFTHESDRPTTAGTSTSNTPMVGPHTSDPPALRLGRRTRSDEYPCDRAPQIQ